MASNDVDPELLRIRMEHAERMHDYYRERVWALQRNERDAVSRAERAERELTEAAFVGATASHKAAVQRDEWRAHAEKAERDRNEWRDFAEFAAAERDALLVRAERAERELAEASKTAFFALVCSKHRGHAHGVGCPFCRAEQAEAAKADAVRVAAARIVNLFEGSLSISLGPTNEEAIEESRAQRGRKDG